MDVIQSESKLLNKIATHSVIHRSIEAKNQGVYPFFRTLSKIGDRRAMMADGKEVLMFGSNSYLGLTSHPKVKEAIIETTQKYGSGCSGARFLNGTIDLHLELEDKLARFVGKEKALVFSTGFQVNLGVIPTLVGKNDFILMDERVHACIIEGTRLAIGKVIKFRHNDLKSLEEKISALPQDAIKLIIVDGVYSMEGDIAKLPEIISLAKKYYADIYVDDAHGVGVLDYGKGTASHLGVVNDVLLVMSTFSKSFATTGGFIAGDGVMIDYLKHTSRTFLFSASLTPASTAAAMAGLEIMQTEKHLFTKLWDNANYLSQQMRDLGWDIGNTETPIIPLMIRDEEKTFLLTKILYEEENIFVNPVISPGVPPGESLLRLSVTAAHDRQDLDHFIESIQRVGKKLRIGPYTT